MSILTPRKSSEDCFFTFFFFLLPVSVRPHFLEALLTTLAIGDVAVVVAAAVLRSPAFCCFFTAFALRRLRNSLFFFSFFLSAALPRAAAVCTQRRRQKRKKRKRNEGKGSLWSFIALLFLLHPVGEGKKKKERLLLQER